MTTQRIALVGAGLAGCECALQLARRGFAVTLFEQKPEAYSPAHSMPQLAELVCSNSLRSDQLTNAVGLLKEEMRQLDSLILRAADANRVPAGGALAVDREKFSEYVTKAVREHPLITVVEGEVDELPQENAVIATGPLTSDKLAEKIAALSGLKTLNFFESAIRSLLKEYIERGKVDVFISYEDYTEENYSLKYNAGLAEQYMTYLKEMAEQFGIENDVRVSTLSHYPDVFVMEEQSPDEQKLWAGLEQALRQAAAQFVESRITEGERLRTDLVEKLDGMISYVDYIEERSPQILDEYRMRLESKVQELLGDRQLDDARIAAEITIFADKICVDEETVRLRSHILSMKETLLAGGGMGRKLDFIAQEMNREANTILSKANDLEISNCAIELKTEIEKVREQIQNIE